MRTALAHIVARVAAAALTVGLAIVTAVGTPSVARAQDPAVRDTATGDSTRIYVLRTRDGSQFIGRLLRATVDSVFFVSAGGPITVPRSVVVELRQIGRGAMRDGVYWAPNPNDTRLLFAPTGRMLAKGEAYFSDTYLFLLLLAGGITPRFTLGGGMSILPSDDFFSNNIYYVTPKVGIVQRENLNIAVGAFAGFLGWQLWDNSDVGSFGIIYGVATVGSPDGHMTFGSGLAYGGGDFADRPLVMIGGEKRLSRRTSFVSENYMLPGEATALISYGLRFFGEKLSVDFALWNAFGEDADPRLPGVPYVSFAVKF